MENSDGNAESTRSFRALLGVGGALSLCCLVAAPAATGAAGAVGGGGTAAALGGSLVQVLATAAAVGLLAALIRLRTGGESCDA
ncbi:hypothetical protein [Halomicrobium salinisoli]|uniref:hypothetical protein n=1 Tax=Halomicrobium salinisoli TaxID=2878391 RepID=UPI001CEFBD2F|nr:hypothetical protein [Halomicrobium salinisoli]